MSLNRSDIACVGLLILLVASHFRMDSYRKEVEEVRKAIAAERAVIYPMIEHNSQSINDLVTMNEQQQIRNNQESCNGRK